MKRFKKGFTLIELVVVIAVIAILSAVSVVSYVSITKKAKESKALQEARMSWTEVCTEYLTYEEFIKSGEEYFGWRYDYMEDVAKYNADNFTVTYNGKDFLLKDLEDDSTLVWNNISESTVNFNTVTIGTKPFGLKLSYYSDIYSRGFSWTTTSSITESKLYLVTGNKGENSDFSSAVEHVGSSIVDNSVCAHKVFVNNLFPSTTYSYKVGSSNNWAYGIFRTASNNPSSITAIQISDAQTQDKSKLYVWENTFAQAIETAGRDLDFILYNGDQFNAQGNSFDYSVAVETIKTYLNVTPYMAAAGNHDLTAVFNRNNCVKFAGQDNVTTKGYYSYNYGDTHFVVLDANDNLSNDRFLTFSTPNEAKVEISFKGNTYNVYGDFETQARWLLNDLETAKQNGAKWIVITTHVGLHSTGDHSDDNQSQRFTYSLCPILSRYHVDLVLQAHDHTYSKTLPYKWDTLGYTTSYSDSNIVNFDVVTENIDDRNYDKNPCGTYYVTTGAAGHRIAEFDGIYADVNRLTGESLYSSMSYKNNYYKTVVGKINQSNSYSDFTAQKKNVDYIYNSNQTFNDGDYATANINANMFGVLNIKDNKLTYDFYTVRGNEVRLFDTLNVMKTL